MRETEAYLNRATLGLWGQKRRDARTELRGAVEDKVYRYRLLGLGEAEALRAALRDLGSPHAIARDLNRVHTLPQAVRAALLAGVATLLGVQALAQVPTVRAVPDPRIQTCTYDEAFLKQLPQKDADDLRRRLAQPGGRAALEAECRAHVSPTPANHLLLLSDLIAALRTGGVTVKTIADTRLELGFPGEKDAQSLDLGLDTQRVAGELYVDAATLIERLRTSLSVPIRLQGIDNPLLQIGPAHLQLGTTATPVRATDMYAFSLAVKLTDELKPMLRDPLQIAYVPEGQEAGPAQHYLEIAAPQNTLYAILNNEEILRKRAGASCCGSSLPYLLRVRTVKKGLLPAPLAEGAQTSFARLVSTPAQLFQATARKERAVLVYRLDPTDLRNLKLIPIPAAQLRIHTAP
ncbi:hypothetical protein DAERI_060042 [Deinococcus aerius]|uniref:Uncharacterized protein n=1 Tax=Deinococcus aerius TaxID=200253 RepID=A0A2I9CV65_9DEIO|nr:permease prefix domain 1-containing protein [Deinococcus aerius]GBF05782.1 hypothetical protein DAERI_060042 [Deinococcus aerius]